MPRREEVRKLRRLRDSQQRDEADVELRERLAAEIVRLFPACPQERAERIAWHTSVRGSGRIGRSAAGRALDGEAVMLAVAASVRHVDTDYDELLMSGVERETARAMVRDDVHKVLEGWRE